MNRSIQAEGAFAVLKREYGFRRFLMQGTENVRTECLVHAMAFNINKLYNQMRKGRFRQTLFRLNAAS